MRQVIRQGVQGRQQAFSEVGSGMPVGAERGWREGCGWGGRKPHKAELNQKAIGSHGGLEAEEDHDQIFMLEKSNSGRLGGPPRKY